MHSLNGYSYKYTHPSDEVLGHFINLSNLPGLILRMGHPICLLLFYISKSASIL